MTTMTGVTSANGSAATSGAATTAGEAAIFGEHARSAVCTLFAGDYDKGVAALANSLYAGGYRGVVWVGYRGELPGWASPCKAMRGASVYEAAEGLWLAFVKAESQRFINFDKPFLLRRVAEELHPEAERVYFFDPDIVVVSGWSFFETWADRGVAVVEDCCYGRFPSNHPHRGTWEAMMRRRGHGEPRSLEAYYNGGFIGVPRSRAGVLGVWCEAMSAMVEEGLDAAVFKQHDRAHPFCDSDQDAMNTMAMFTDAPLSAIGPEGMGFTPPIYLMAHAASAPKPWKANYVREWLRTGGGPSRVHRAFWDYVTEPIAVFGPGELRRRRLSLKVASALGRHLGRSER